MDRFRLTAVAVLAAVALLGGCREGPDRPAEEIEEARFEGADIDPAVVPDAALARARSAADDLTRDLASLVFSTMEERGTLAAVEVCSGVAQERTAAHAEEGVRIRRVSNRLRNPLNAPTESEARELERLETLAGQGRAPAEIVRLVRTGDDRALHYMRPIFVMEPCLACHGAVESIDPEVRAVLEERYPDDAAVGYEAGDLRGAVSVLVDLDSR